MSYDSGRTLLARIGGATRVGEFIRPEKGTSVLTIWALAFFLLPPASPSLGPDGRATADAIHPPLVLSAIESESDLPPEEYLLADRDERDPEEEDGTDSKVLRVALIQPVLDRPASTRSGFTHAHAWVLGYGAAPKTPILRC